MNNITDASSMESNLLPKNISKRILISWIFGLLALTIASWSGDFFKSIGIDGRIGYALQALIMTGLVVPWILMMRKKIDRGFPQKIGIGTFHGSMMRFFLGIGLIAVPLIISLFFAEIFNWGSINFNLNSSIIITSISGIITVLLFEALPEELIFRGYIYSNLNTKYKRWLSALMTVGLFVLLPLVLVLIQKYLLGMDIYIGGSNRITLGYIINLIFFGLFVQYLRILTDSIWTGIGFHLVFVYLNQMIGMESSSLIQLSNFESELPMQITLISTVGLIFITLIFYPVLKKKKLGWSELSIS